MKQSFLMFECDYTKPFIFFTLTLPCFLKSEDVLRLGCGCPSVTDSSDRKHIFTILRLPNVLPYHLYITIPMTIRHHVIMKYPVFLISMYIKVLFIFKNYIS